MDELLYRTESERSFLTMSVNLVGLLCQAEIGGRHREEKVGSLDGLG